MTIPTRDNPGDVEDTLAYIRQTMESASSFTAISGWGLVGAGTTGLVASWISWASDSVAEIQVWIPAAIIALAISLPLSGIKAKRSGARSLWSASFTKLAWIMAPVLVVGALLTLALAESTASHLLPGMWLSVYGAGVTAGGTQSLREFRWIGSLLITLGALAMFVPDLSLGLLAIGFGALHVMLGLDIVRRHGG